MWRRMEFSEEINRGLGSLDRSQSWLADQLNVSPATVSRWINQESRPSSPELVANIADILGFTDSKRKWLLLLAGYAYQEDKNTGGKVEEKPTSFAATDQYEEKPVNWMHNPIQKRLFGLQSQIAQLLNFLNAQDNHYIISICGIGGIGKTTLTEATINVLRTQSSWFQNILWVNGRQQSITKSGITDSKIRINTDILFRDLLDKLGIEGSSQLPINVVRNRLAQEFRNHPYLVIIDNLESNEDLEQIVSHLTYMVQPSKFLLTTREDMLAIEGITRIWINEIDKSESLRLIDYLAQEKNIENMESGKVYELVGGNPLAIHLAVSQIKVIPLERVLSGIKLGSIEEIYKYVYLNLWSALNQDEHRVLFTIQRTGDQSTWNWLEKTSKVPDLYLPNAMKRLIEFSLVTPPLDSPTIGYYSIHRLTSTFLCTEVLNWK